MNLKHLFKKYFGWAVFVLASGLLVYANFSLDVHLSDFELYHHETGVRETVSLPLSRQSSVHGGTYDLQGQISFGWYASKDLHIVPDDVVKRILINGKEVDLSAIPEERLSDWENGFMLNVGPYVTRGDNSILITFADNGGEGLMGMKIVSQYGARVIAISILWIILVSATVILKTGVLLKIPGQRSILYCLIVLGALLHIWNIYTYNPADNVWSDAQRHWEQGTDRTRNDLMSNTDPIMYQIYIGALEKLSLNLPMLIAFYTSLLSLLGTWFWYRFFRELQSNKTAALAGWAAVSLLPSWIAIYNYYMQETLLLPLLGAALWATWRARRKATVQSFVLMVVLWILAGLTRGIAIPLAAVCCTALWLTQAQKLRKALISAAVMLLILGPLTYRSYQTVHHFAPHGMGYVASIYAKSGKKEIHLHIRNQGGEAMYGFGSPSTGARPFAPFSDWETRRRGEVHVFADLEKGREDWDKAYANVAKLTTWRDTLWITKENLIFLFFGPSWPDNNDTRLLDNISVHMRWIWAPAFLAALIWTFRLRRKLRHQWLLPCVILAWFVVQGLLVISVNEGRYRKPFEGLIISQFLLLAAVRRGEARVGQPYDPGFDYARWMDMIKSRFDTAQAPSAPGEPALAAASSANEAPSADQAPGENELTFRQRNILE